MVARAVSVMGVSVYLPGRARGLSAVLGMALIGLAATGCSSTEGNIALGVGAATVVGGNAPTHEIEQTYYVGSFDPLEQLPPTTYRVRVRGQSSFISTTKFASGWVPAPLIDSLSASVGSSEETGAVKVDKGEADLLSKLELGRRMVLFGPDGFLEAPRDHRLVVVMGSNPEGFFKAVDSVLGEFSSFKQQERNGELTALLFDALVRIDAERIGLQELDRDLALEFGTQ